jgi:hypothetical protein
LELSSPSNQGGRFIEISDYHSGSQRGGGRVPKGSQGTGWSLFVNELRQFFLHVGDTRPTYREGGRSSDVTSTVTEELRMSSNTRFDPSHQLRDLHESWSNLIGNSNFTHGYGR